MASDFFALSLGMVPQLPSASAAELPESFNLLDRGVVTSIKTQSPWGSCWAFGASAAAESSILSEMGLTSDEYNNKYGRELDLSEKHLAWWAYHSVPKKSEDATQAGEGVYIFRENPKHKIRRNAAYDMGGTPICATSIYSSGMGPVIESGKMTYGGYDNKGRRSYGRDADWTLPDKTREYFSFEIEDGNMLPTPAVWKGDSLNEKGYLEYDHYDPAGTQAIKEELYKGKGVSIAYEADISNPEELLDLQDGESAPTYMSKNWAQYIDEDIMPNHMVCIIGWDDNYPVENFNEGHRPPAAGAWLVKNSWGTGTADESSHDFNDEWGIVDENGKHTGCFWLSYYDQSICMPESFNFDLKTTSKKEMIVGEYDFLQGGAQDSIDLSSRKKIQMANVFKAPKDMKLRAVGVDTFAPDTTVHFDVYRTDVDYSATPTKGKKIASKTVKIPYAGYHRVRLDSKFTIKKGDYYSVVVSESVKTKHGRRYLTSASFGYGKQLSRLAGQPFYSKAVVNFGESYYGYIDKNGVKRWVDWKNKIVELKKTAKDVELIEIDNFPIKAFSDPIRKK